MRLLAAGLVCYVLAFLLALHGKYAEGAVFAALGSLAWIWFGAALPSDDHCDARQRNPITRPGRRS